MLIIEQSPKGWELKNEYGQLLGVFKCLQDAQGGARLVDSLLGEQGVLGAENA